MINEPVKLNEWHVSRERLSQVNVHVLPWKLETMRWLSFALEDSERRFISIISMKLRVETGRRYSITHHHENLLIVRPHPPDVRGAVHQPSPVQRQGVPEDRRHVPRHPPRLAPVVPRHEGGEGEAQQRHEEGVVPEESRAIFSRYSGKVVRKRHFRLLTSFGTWRPDPPSGRRGRWSGPWLSRPCACAPSASRCARRRNLEEGLVLRVERRLKALLCCGRGDERWWGGLTLALISRLSQTDRLQGKAWYIVLRN